jgi:septum site-determining protein MinD
MSHFRSFTFAINKGGVGKTVLLTNLGIALAEGGRETVLLDASPELPIAQMLGDLSGVEDVNNAPTLSDALEHFRSLDEVLIQTQIPHLKLLIAGITLEQFFTVNPVRFAQTLQSASCKYLLLDTFATIGRAGLLTIGMSQYFVPVLQPRQLEITARAAFLTYKLAKYYLGCSPLGFVMNCVRREDYALMTKELNATISEILNGMECIAQINYDDKLDRSVQQARLAVHFRPKCQFSESIRKIADRLRNAPNTRKIDFVDFFTARTKTVIA